MASNENLFRELGNDVPEVDTSSTVQIDKIRDKQTVHHGISRRFIILGEGKSGKSTLGNLLLGPRESKLFGTGWYSNPSMKAKAFLMGETEISEIVAREKDRTHNSKEKLRIEVVDDPNCVKQEKHEQFLTKCINKNGNPERITFLILIDLNFCTFSKEEFKKIKDAEQILSKLKFELLTHAVVVFTHVDELVLHSKETPGQILNKRLQRKESFFIKRLLDLVHQRHILINAMNFSRINRNEILNKLFEFANWDSDFGVKIIDKVRDLNTAFNTPIRIFSDNTQEEREEEIYQEVLKLGEKLPEDFQQENNIDSCQYTCIVLKRNETTREDLIKLSPPQTLEGNSDKKVQIDRKEQRSNITDKIDVKQIAEALNELSTTSKIPIEIFSDETEDEYKEEIYQKILKLSEAGPLTQDDLDESWTFTCIVLTKRNRNQEPEIQKKS